MSIPKMNIVLLNHSVDSTLTGAIVTEIARALEAQLYQHYAPFCQTAGCRVTLLSSYTQVGPNDCPIAIFDNPDQAGALGWHSVTPDGRAYGKVFWLPIKNNGGKIFEGSLSLSAALSHECLEAAGNPYVNGWHDMGDGRTEDATEECDRVEDDAYQMPGTRIWVSNFLGPRSFRPGTGPYDWMNLCRRPFEIRPGGYAIRRVGGPSGTVKAVWAENYPEWKKELKMHPSSKLSRRLKAKPSSVPPPPIPDVA